MFFSFVSCNFRSSPKKKVTPEKSPQIQKDDEDDGSLCSICLETWEWNGQHRLVSLKCGHLFGDSCIRR